MSANCSNSAKDYSHNSLNSPTEKVVLTEKISPAEKAVGR